jgi:hypothetical protein
MRNQRDGTFRDVTAASGLNQNNTRYSFCCGWSDYNRDGWPDLYVVNDFGRKNLYRNNGDGTFTDVAPQAGAEDIGAGMSVCWLDYDNDGAEDLYVANMWTAAGERVSPCRNFKKDSSVKVRALYQKHAMGNSLLHNRGQRSIPLFDDATLSATALEWAAGPGRATPSTSITTASRPLHCQRHGLRAFGARSIRPKILRPRILRPKTSTVSSGGRWSLCRPTKPGLLHVYEQGWNAINELIRSDGTWSGYERNVFYANNRDGTFSDVSAVLGLDFVEDGRAFALADFDHDGRLEVFLKNRNAPQLRILKNVAGGSAAVDHLSSARHKKQP